ncbi:MAG: zinc-dependent metalloprotease [Proteobacteria bacterium]|nr:zinc-dependent metalloprotease [Pseudomonadota bacterium]
MLRWVNDAEAGQDYAERNSDPFTGQLRGASVTSTPVFSLVVASEAPMIAIKAQLERGLPLAGIDDARMTEIEHDYYVNTFTHEIGHALGLRHNFAGNPQTELTAREIDDAIASYVANRQDNRLGSKALIRQRRQDNRASSSTSFPPQISRPHPCRPGFRTVRPSPQAHTAPATCGESPDFAILAAAVTRRTTDGPGERS